MKDKKHIKSFLEHTEKLNISDVSDSGLFESKLGDGKFITNNKQHYSMMEHREFH